MTKLWTRYPQQKHQQTRDIILGNGIGAVVPCDAWSLYPDMDMNNPRWAYIDERIDSIPEGHPIHFHPVLTRVRANLWSDFLRNLKGYVWPILERYYGRVERITIANEVMLISRETQWAIINLMEGIYNEFPDYELWIGEYGLRSNQRVSGSGGIIDCIYELKAAADLKGIVCIDYIDLAHSRVNQIFQGWADQLPVSQNWLDKNNLSPETVGDWIKAIEGKHKTVRVPQKLDTNLEKIATTGVKIALETSVYTGPEPTPYTEARQAVAYKLLYDVCSKYDAELWAWSICDQSASIAWAKERQVNECPGFYDRNGDIKPWAIDLLKFDS